MMAMEMPVMVCIGRARAMSLDTNGPSLDGCKLRVVTAQAMLAASTVWLWPAQKHLQMHICRCFHLGLTSTVQKLLVPVQPNAVQTFAMV